MNKAGDSKKLIPINVPSYICVITYVFDLSVVPPHDGEAQSIIPNHNVTDLPLGKVPWVILKGFASMAEFTHLSMIHISPFTLLSMGPGLVTRLDTLPIST